MKETEDCFLKIKNPYINFLKEEKIFNKNKVSIKSLKNIYIPLCFWIENQYLKNRKTLFLGFSGCSNPANACIFSSIHRAIDGIEQYLWLSISLSK